MNDPLSELGQSLAEDFRSNLNKWFVLEAEFDADRVFGSIEAVAENSNTEEVWEDLSATNSFLETDFLPDDLVEGFFENIVQEQDSEIARSHSKSINSLPTSSFKKNSLTKEGSNIDKNDRSRQHGIVLDNDDHKEATEAPSSFINKKESNIIRKNELLSDEFFEKSNTSSEPDSHSDEESGMKEQIENEHSFKNPPKPPQIGVSIDSTSSFNRTTTTDNIQVADDVDDTKANSIWKTPLRNLNDFAGQVSKPVSNEKDDSKESINRLHTSRENSPRASMAPVSQFIQKPTEDWTNVTNWSGYQNPIIQPATESHTAYKVSAPTTPLRSENIPFPDAAAKHPTIPDTEELLDALTERILRDFRRYYP